MIKKSPLVKAMKQVLKEYREETHTLEMRDCAMCKLYRDIFGYTCGNCPMAKVFHRCGSRWCAPVRCNVHHSTKNSRVHKQKLQAVQEFYIKAIARVRRMTVSELNAYGAFEFLKDIDMKVAEKYFLKKDQ